MHFLITGHTGFKGAWLSLLLHQRGHQVSGISLNPVGGSLFEGAQISDLLENDIRCDIRESVKLSSHFEEINPDVVIHLAAQSLVRESYKNPLSTFETNVFGTLNVLRASQQVESLKAQLIVTTDKVYKNISKQSGYIETDTLGGEDPYSASKAMADIATQSWLSSFENPPTSIVRAGNVIGGGDICIDRLVPDLMNAFSKGETPKLRAPDSIRPWQHVLDCLNGYLMLVDSMIRSKQDLIWNFGPKENQIQTVADVANIAATIWGISGKWEMDLRSHPHEAKTLILNTSKAREKLGWQDKLDFYDCISWTVNWYKNVTNGSSPFEEMIKNINEFESRE